MNLNIIEKNIVIDKINKINEEFLYRQIPVNYDGKGTLKSIKGNTVSFNQLVQNGNFDVIGSWQRNVAGTISVANNILTFTNDTGRTLANWETEVKTPSFSIPANHIFYCHFEIKPNNYAGTNAHIGSSPSGNVVISFVPTSVPQNVWTKMTFRGSFDREITNLFIRMIGVSNANGTTSQMKNFYLMDLTLMGIDNLTTTAQVEAWLSSHIGDLPYYDYTQGTLIPFMGSGLKTTGKNLVFSTINGCSINSVGQIITDASFNMQIAQIIKGETYIIKSDEVNGRVCGFFYDVPTLNSVSYDNSRIVNNNMIFVAPISGYIAFRSSSTYSTPQCEFGSTSTTYEPYTSNTLSLPTSTYFPTGMKSARSVYDESTESKAITRIKSDNLGDLMWTYNSTNKTMYSQVLSDVSPTGFPYVVCGRYEYQPTSGANMTDKSCKIDEGRIYVKDLAYTDATTFKQAMADQNVKVYYELATPIETDISLDLTYPVWNGGTEQILPINGSTPDTAPIKANITYECEGSYATGEGEYSSGATATLTAFPKNGNVFVGWFDGDTFLSASNPYSYTVTQDKTLTAMFGVQNNMFVKVNGTWKNGISYLKNNGSWI